MEIVDIIPGGIDENTLNTPPTNWSRVFTQTKPPTTGSEFVHPRTAFAAAKKRPAGEWLRQPVDVTSPGEGQRFFIDVSFPAPNGVLGYRTKEQTHSFGGKFWKAKKVCLMEVVPFYVDCGLLLLWPEDQTTSSVTLSHWPQVRKVTNQPLLGLWGALGNRKNKPSRVITLGS